MASIKRSNIMMNSPGIRKRKGLNVLIYVFLSSYALIILYPLVFVLLASLKNNEEIFSSPWKLPEHWEWKKYIEIITKYGLGGFLLNSVYFTSISVSISVFISSTAAYALTRMNWPLKSFVFALILFGLMVPIHSELVPLYIMFSRIGFRNPRFTLVGVYVAFSLPLTIFILTGFLRGIPKEMEESAVMEGSTIIKAFFRVIWPLMNPAIVTVIILNFLNVWNDFFAGLVFISQDKDKTLQLGIARFQGNFGTNYSYLLGAIILAILPSILIYLVIQDKIIDGVTAGAVKG